MYPTHHQLLTRLLDAAKPVELGQHGFACGREPRGPAVAVGGDGIIGRRHEGLRIRAIGGGVGVGGTRGGEASGERSEVGSAGRAAGPLKTSSPINAPPRGLPKEKTDGGP